MEYHAVLEPDPETGHVCATVVELPGIIVDGKDEEDALRLLKQAILFTLEEGPPVGPVAKMVPFQVQA